jgi:L-aspartate oxidase
MQTPIECDILIIGAGAAGLSLALRLPSHTTITILCKSNTEHSSTYWAQGGIAAVIDDDDSIEDHVNDTLIAGAGLCHKKTVHFVVSNSKKTIDWLIDLGVPFTKKPTQANFHLTKEGGHSKRRIIHADDATGKALISTLHDQVKSRSNITLLDNHLAIDIIKKDNRCRGAYILDRESKKIFTYKSKCVALATGGASKSYLYTTNPHGSSGDGIAMGWRAGCDVANMEFNQFHPTCLYHPNAGPYLITEAMRGEGGQLKLPHTNKRFMFDHDKRGELAPRDIVARAIDHEMKRHGCDFIHLDISHKSASFITSHFPNIYTFCKKLGIDITQEPIPVVPAAHYTCGGLIINQHGETNLPGLYALGECTFTGLHGANRLASNSILECLVYAFSVAQHITKNISPLPFDKEIDHWDESQVVDADEKVIISHNWEELRRFMWDYVGIVRTDKRLERALRRVKLLKQEIDDYYSQFKIDSDLIELRNLTLVSELIIMSAIKRKESRGLHFTLDHLNAIENTSDTILTPDKVIKD